MTKKKRSNTNDKLKYIPEEYQECKFLKVLKAKNKYVYYRCNLTTDSKCICQYRKCTLFVDKETYKKNAEKYPIKEDYQCSKPMHD